MRPALGLRGLRGRRARLSRRPLPRRRRLTRVCIISDTHLPRGARRLPDACLELLREADVILHGGDVKTAAVLEELRQLGPPVEAVWGNADEADLQAALPREQVVRVDEVRIGLVHVPGARAGREARLRRLFPDCDAIVYGHTHLPQVDLFEGVWILNPGSPTDRRRAPARSMLVLDVDGAAVAPRLVTLP